ncbi:hypothetical protein [Roseateles sp. MS654]|uniref:hypothetical protein n=1 Tax=Roseateles sp. MS654 TaxID=3412685 RepID=UPI003C30A1E1
MVATGTSKQHQGTVFPLSGRQMEISLLFVLRSSIALAMIVGALVFCESAYSTSLPGQSVLETTPESPIRIGRAGGYVWAEYCPDNTCDVFRSRDKRSGSNFLFVAASYYFYFSRYAYLESWQRDANVQAEVENALESIKSKTCAAYSGRKLAKCEILEMNKRNSVQVRFVRFDERHNSSQRIPLEEALR